MLKHKYLKTSLFFLTLFVGVFFIHGAKASADLVATPISVTKTTYQWLDMSDIQMTFKCYVPPGSAKNAACQPPDTSGSPTTLVFHDDSATQYWPYGYQAFTATSSDSSNAGCQGTNSVIQTNFANSSTIANSATSYAKGVYVQWNYHNYGYLGSSYCSSSYIDSNGKTQNSYDPNHSDYFKIADPLIDGLKASSIFFQLSTDKTSIGYTDSHPTGSWGDATFTQCSSNLNEYEEGGCSGTGCSNLLVVEANNDVYLWPLTGSANTDGYTFVKEPSNDETKTQLGILGCKYIKGSDLKSIANNGDSFNSGINVANLAYQTSKSQLQSTGQILTAVPGLKYIKNTSGTGPPTGCTGSACNTPQNTSTCDSSGGDLAYIVCAVIRLATSAEQAIEQNFITPLLQTNTIDFNPNTNCNPNNTACSKELISSSILHIVSNFKIYANILLVVGILVVVYAETIGGTIGDAYAARKILPRLLITAILINLAVYIVGGLEDIFNVLGSGLLSLMEKPFLAANIHSLVVAQGTGRLAFGLGLGTLAVVGFTQGIAGIALFIIGSALLSTIGVLVTLIIRQGLLLFLLVTSPIAFLLNLLPNTEQYFRKWWSLLLRTLVVYPIVEVVFAMSYITATIVSNFGIHPVIVAQLIAIFAEVVPLFLIPFAFKLSGGIIGNVQGFVSNATKQLKQPIDNLRKANQAARMERAKQGNLWRGDNALARGASRAAQKTMMANRAGLRPWKWRTNLGTAVGTKTFDDASEFLEKNATMNHIKHDDDKMWALMNGHSEEEMGDILKQAAPERFKGTQNEHSLNEALSELSRVRKEGGDKVARVAATRAQATTGTGFRDSAQMLESINTAAGGDRSMANTMLGEMRTSAMQSGRVDLGAAGFANMSKNMDMLNKGTVSHADANSDVMSSVIDSSGASQALYGKPQSAGAIARAHSDKINGIVQEIGAADSRGDTAAVASHERDLNQSLASAMGIYDAMGQASPQNAREFANGLMSAQIVDPRNGASGNVFDMANLISQSPGNDEFVKMRRDYSSAVANQARQAAGTAPGTAALPTQNFGPPTP